MLQGNGIGLILPLRLEKLQLKERRSVQNMKKIQLSKENVMLAILIL